MFYGGINVTKSVGAHAQRDLEARNPGPTQSGALLHSGFVAQVRQRPHALCLVDGARELSYEQMDRWACWLAQGLAALKVERGEVVAVMCRNGWAQVAAMLGVLRAGAAFLPIDPRWPEERRGRLLRTGNLRFVVSTRSALAPGICPLPMQSIVIDETGGEAPPTLPMSAGFPQPAGDDLAYVIPGSAPAGAPQGVKFTHGVAAGVIDDINERFSVGAGDRIIAVSGMGLQQQIYDVFGGLSVGGAVVVPGMARDPADWIGLTAEHGVTLWNSLPATMHRLVDYAREKPGVALPWLRLVLLSGEPVAARLPQLIRALAPAAQVVCLGLAPEAAVWSSIYTVGEIDSAWNWVPYGRALRDRELHVRNERGK
jgi:pyochelin synthetase